jgi:hypothetical protein
MSYPPPESPSADGLVDVLFELRTRGITVWFDDGRLRYRALRGKPAEEDLETLRANRTRILELLDRESVHPEAQPHVVPRAHTGPVPLTFTQRLQWNGLGLLHRPSMRSVAAVLQLTGQPDFQVLQRCFAELITRHESLRTRVVAAAGTPLQVVDLPAGTPLQRVDLTALCADAQDAELNRQLRQMVDEEFSVAVGPLFVARFFNLNPSVHVLAIAVDHIVSDGASVGILLREICALYQQFSRGVASSLPQLRIQFPDYAQWQFETQHLWEQRLAPYWRERLAGASRMRLFPNVGISEITTSRVIARPFNYGSALSTDLQELCRKLKTSLALGVFTAYCALLLRWCERTESIIQFLTRGRHQPDLENVIGSFGHPLFLRVEISHTDSFRNLLIRITSEYDSAYRHDDDGRFPAQSPMPEFVRNPAFSWNPRNYGLDRTELSSGLPDEGRLLVEQKTFETVLRDGSNWDVEPRLDLSDTTHGVAGTIKYRSDLIPQQDIERFERGIRLFAERFVLDPGTRIASIPLPQ